jgi:hypothetical protein
MMTMRKTPGIHNKCINIQPLSEYKESDAAREESIDSIRYISNVSVTKAQERS